MLAEGQKLSVVIITKNEEANIERCIRSCQKVSTDIVVVDATSEDRTVQIAQNLGARVYQKEWIGYGANKNFGNEKALNKWILSLDADEELDEDLIRNIQNLALETNTVYSLNRMTKLGETNVQYSGWHPLFMPRIFNRNDAKWNDAKVHESLVLPKNVILKKINGLIIHYSFPTQESLVTKLDHYAQLRAKEWIATQKPPSKLKRMIGPLGRFFTTFFFKRGFLDGSIGYFIAKSEADMVKKSYYYFDQYTKNE